MAFKRPRVQFSSSPPEFRLTRNREPFSFLSRMAVRSAYEPVGGVPFSPNVFLAIALTSFCGRSIGKNNVLDERYRDTNFETENKKDVRVKSMKSIIQESFFHGASWMGQNFIA